MPATVPNEEIRENKEKKHTNLTWFDRKPMSTKVGLKTFTTQN